MRSSRQTNTHIDTLRHPDTWTQTDTKTGRNIDRHTYTVTPTHTHTETHRQTERQRYPLEKICTQIDTNTGRHTDTCTHKQGYRRKQTSVHTDRHTGAKRHPDTHIQTDRHIKTDIQPQTHRHTDTDRHTDANRHPYTQTPTYTGNTGYPPLERMASFPLPIPNQPIHLVLIEICRHPCVCLSCIFNTLQRWVDEYLRWNSTLYNDVDQIWIPAPQIWTPDIFINNL